jgi:hypothetical protein
VSDNISSNSVKVLLCATVQTFGNNLNKPKFYSGRNEEWIEVRGCMLSSGPEYFVYQFAIQKCKD